MSEKETIFFDGLYSNEVPESAPSWIMGKGSINVKKMIKFLTEHEQYAVNGYLDYTILRSKNAGNRYAVLDTYRFEKSLKDNLEAENEAFSDGPNYKMDATKEFDEPSQAVKPTIVHQGNEIDVDSIPF